MEIVAPLVAGTLFVLLFPTLLYAFGSSRKNWGLVRDGRLTWSPGTYRAAPRAVWVEGSAPLILRIAAFSSFVLGQMVFPGALSAIVGFIALFATLAEGKFSLTLTVVTLSAPTGLIVAGRLLGAGLRLLGRDPRAVPTARAAASWEIWHNAALLGGLCLGAIAGKDEERLCCALIGALTLLAVGHGLLLQRAASALEAYDAAERESAPEGERAVPAFG